MATRRTQNGPWHAVRASLQDAANPSVAERSHSTAPTRGTILGITVPFSRATVKDFATARKELTVSAAADIADLAFGSTCREEMLFATFLLGRFKTKFESSLWSKLSDRIDDIDSWKTCDQLAMGVAGEMMGRADEPQRAEWNRDLEKWSETPNPRRRRCAVATTTVLNPKGRRDSKTALNICERVIADTDKSVQKAVGWALREASKSDAAAVFSLLTKHQAHMPRAVLRESAQKLTAAQRRAPGFS